MRKKIMTKLLSISIALSLIILVSIGDATTSADLPIQADISISRIFLSDPDSVKKVLGNIPRPEDSYDDFPIIQVCNSNSSEILTLVFHYGDVKNSFNEFRVKKNVRESSKCIKPLEEIEQFISGKGVCLGNSKSQVIEILGSVFNHKTNGNRLTLIYKIDDFDNSLFLKEYNLPIYFGNYHFIDDVLVEFEFGFEYP